MFFFPAIFWWRRAKTLKHQGEFVCNLQVEMIVPTDLQTELKVADLQVEMDCH
jgi:hypothetical protein